MAVPFHTIFNSLKTIIEAEFTDRSVTVVPDKLHPALGTERLEVGLSPVREVAMSGNEITLVSTVLLQWYDLWDKEVDPGQMVSPFPITELADRLRRAINAAGNTGTSDVWYYKVTDISYDDDPTGNKTRFEATILAYGDNTEFVTR